MIAFIASSKLSGWSETGFAFGMVRPPMASAFAHSSPRILAEHALQAACSATCYDCVENIRILAVIVAERELRQVQRQVCLAHIVERAHDATLQQAPEAIQVRRVNVAAHILALGMVDRLVRELTVQTGIASVFISGDQRHPLVYRLTHELTQCESVGIFDDLADHISLASNRTDHTDLSAANARQMRPFVTVAVFILAADVGFINLHFAHKLSKAPIFHRRSDSVAHIPGRPVVAAADLPMDLQGTDALLALGHQVNDLEPDPQGIVGILKDGFGQNGEAVAIPPAAILMFADPMKRAGLQDIHLGILAARAFDPIRPAHLSEKHLAGFFGRKAGRQLRKGHGGLGRHGCSPLLEAV